MREILFKAKRIDNGEWVQGYFVKSNEKIATSVIITCIDSTFPEMWPIYEVDENTICQYTGLTDKNGNKIWENDIVKYHFGDDIAEIKFGEYQSCFDSQKTCHIGFYVDWKKRNLRKDLGYWVKMIDCNIIGNIFDNTELLEIDYG